MQRLTYKVYMSLFHYHSKRPGLLVMSVPIVRVS